MVPFITPRRLIVAITGASGAIYGVRLLEHLRTSRAVETHLLVSQAGVLPRPASDVGVAAKVAVLVPSPTVTFTAGAESVREMAEGSGPLTTAEVRRAEAGSKRNSLAVGSLPAASMTSSSSAPGTTMRRLERESTRAAVNGSEVCADRMASCRLSRASASVAG